MRSIYKFFVFSFISVQICVPFIARAVESNVINTNATYTAPDTSTNFNEKIAEKILKTEKIEKISDILLPIDSNAVTGLKGDKCPKPIKKAKGAKVVNESTIALQYINQEISLDKDYVPPGLVDVSSYFNTLNKQTICLRPAVAAQLIAMSKDMEKEGLKLRLNSGFRSFYQQATLYKKYAPKTKYELPIVAKAGHSEHQTGFGFDLASDTSPGEFAFTPESDWVKNNSYKYGFLVSYPEKSEEKTGYRAEAWHIRYVGKENASVLHSAEYTLAYKTAYYQPTVLSVLLQNLKRKILENNAKDQIGG